VISYNQKSLVALTIALIRITTEGGGKNTHVIYIQLYIYVTFTIALTRITTDGGKNIYIYVICTIIHVYHTYNCTHQNNDGGGNKIYMLFIYNYICMSHLQMHSLE